MTFWNGYQLENLRHANQISTVKNNWTESLIDLVYPQLRCTVYCQKNSIDSNVKKILSPAGYQSILLGRSLKTQQRVWHWYFYTFTVQLLAECSEHMYEHACAITNKNWVKTTCSNHALSTYVGPLEDPAGFVPFRRRWVGPLHRNGFRNTEGLVTYAWVDVPVQLVPQLPRVVVNDSCIIINVQPWFIIIIHGQTV